MNNFLKEVSERILLFDGSKGTMLQNYGLKGSECPELWNKENSETVTEIYRLYKLAGSDVIQSNTFQGNPIKLREHGLEKRTYELNFEGVRLAKKVMGSEGYVAASIGPTGKLFTPAGDLTFEKAYTTFKKQITAVVDAGADIINFETFNDMAEMRAALIAAKENTDLPVICSMAFESNGRTLMGTDPRTAAVVLKSMGADMIGVNCSVGPENMIDLVRKMYETGGAYISVKPNAGLPVMVDGKVKYNETPERFAEFTEKFVKYGARLVGGCCGTTPEFIKSMAERLKHLKPVKTGHGSGQIIASANNMIDISEFDDVNMGKLDTYNDEELFEELSNGNMEFLIDRLMGFSACNSIHINVDRLKEKDIIEKVVDAVQTYSRKPVIIESTDYDIIEKALRKYNGKAGVVIDKSNNSDIEKIVKIIGKYGGTIIDNSDNRN